MVANATRTGNKGGKQSRPSLADEAWELYRLAEALGDTATMQIASRDIAIAQELEAAEDAPAADELMQPLDRYGLPGCRYTQGEHAGIAAMGVSADFGRSPDPRFAGTISTVEYARRHGLTEDAVRSRIYRGALKARRVNVGYRDLFRIPVNEEAA